MSAHTPGPWHIGPHYKSDVESAFGRICECGITRGRNSEANARLIAAAPELYDAVKEYLDWGPMTGSDRDLFNGKFSKAIAKAEGQCDPRGDQRG